jgi:two-component system, chemotaxis family, sensor kinase Cph1
MNDHHPATKESPVIDLSNCDQEPIHIPGCIQPHGLLLVVTVPDLIIVQASANIVTLLGQELTDVLNAPLQVVCDSQLVQTLRVALTRDQIEAINPLVVSLRGAEDQVLALTALVHRIDHLLIIEFEPRDPRETDQLPRLYQRAQHAIIRLNSTHSLQDLYHVIAEEMHKVTGFDRVMVYQFDSHWNGEVVAEAKVEAARSYAGLWFPASDIPKQARELYLHTWLRVIPDVAYTPVPIVPGYNPRTRRPLNLSASVLRSVSPMHIQYLKHMDVRATLTISLIVNHTLWGLIVCHHLTPRYLSYQVRTICAFIGQTCSSLILAKAARDDLMLRLNAITLQTELFSALDRQSRIAQSLSTHLDLLRHLVHADGVAVVLGDTLVHDGPTPEQGQMRAIVEWLATRDEEVIATHAFSELYPPALDYTDVASGLLAIVISRRERACLLWFRPEVIHTVTWGGNPQKPVDLSADGTQLTPRASFEQWKETVRFTSQPWHHVDVETATALRLKLIDRLGDEGYHNRRS